MSVRMMMQGRKPAAGGSTFDPLSVSWFVACWAGDPSWTAPADGGAVASWRNAGTSATALTQATSSRQPTFRSSVAALGGLPAVEFDGGDDITASLGSASQPNEVFAVVNQIGTTGDQTLMDGESSSGRHLLRVSMSTGRQIFAGTSLAGGVRSSGALAVRAIYNGASSSLHVNGTSVLSGNAGTQSLVSLRVGCDRGIANYFTGHIAFLGIKNGTLTSTERSDLLAWAQSHYGTP